MSHRYEEEAEISISQPWPKSSQVLDFYPKITSLFRQWLSPEVPANHVVNCSSRYLDRYLSPLIYQFFQSELITIFAQHRLVSDTAFHKGEQFDVAGPSLCESVKSHGSFRLGPTKIVPDEVINIRQQVLNWASLKGAEKVHWIIVTGGQYELRVNSRNLLLTSPGEVTGTGWGDRDVTPQVSSHA
jgi:hypothetical protein